MATGFDWDGVYIGGSVEGALITGGGTFAGAFASLGWGMTADSFYFGLEGTAGGVAGTFLPGIQWRLEGIARAGVLVTDDVLLYAQAGGAFGIPFGPFGIVGAGAEFAVTDNMSLNAQYRFEFVPGVGSAHVGRLGLNWHL